MAKTARIRGFSFSSLSEAFPCVFINHPKRKSSMKVTVNNRPAKTQAHTVKQLAEEMQLPAAGVAVAIGNKMVPRDQWENTPVTEGADIVIVKAFCGG